MLCSTINSLWQLYFFYGVLAAMGMGTIYVPSTSVTVKWFPQRRGLATGVVVAGLSLGMLTLAPLAKLFIEVYGWRPAFAFLGVTFIALLAPAMFLLRDPEEGRALERGFLRDYEARAALKTKLFWLTYSAFALGSLSATMVIIHIVPYAEDLGIPAIAAALTVSLIGVNNLVGRVAMGALLDKVGLKVTLALCFTIQAACIWALLGARTLLALYVVAAALGFFYGWVALYAPTAASLFGIKSVGSLLGVLVTSYGLGAMLGPSIVGVLFDATKSYSIPFTLGASLSLLSTLLVVLARAKREA
jgi:predicted MFS family arabinose efflux permease